MSQTLRVLLAIGAVAVAVVLFVVLQDSGEDETSVSTTQTTAEAPAESEAQAEQPQEQEPEKEKPEKPAEPEVPTIVFRGGEPVGGVQELSFTKGDRIRFDVTSDVADHVHLHGYDVFQDIAAGETISFDVPATIEGVFEVELEDRVVPLAEISVNPG